VNSEDNNMPDRKCGECSECCKVLPIVEFNKPRHVPCTHLCPLGCGIYKDPKKPKVCSSFRCEWLDGNVPEYDRPDKLGVMFWYSDKCLRVSETRPGAIEKGKVTVLV